MMYVVTILAGMIRFIHDFSIESRFQLSLVIYLKMHDWYDGIIPRDQAQSGGKLHESKCDHVKSYGWALSNTPKAIAMSLSQFWIIAISTF